MRMIKKRGQVWVETVVYTLIGLAIIGIVLAAAIPKINNKKDEVVIEQSIEALGKIDEKIYEVIDQGVGNRRVVDLEISKGVLIVDMDEETISWILNSGVQYSEENVDIPLGNLNITTTKKGSSSWEVKIRVGYNIDIRYNGENSGQKQLDPAPAPYKFVIENLGSVDNNIVINLNEA